MKQILLIVAVAALVGCGKKEEKAATSADRDMPPVVPPPIDEDVEFGIGEVFEVRNGKLYRQWIPPEEITDQRTIDFQIRNVFFGGFGYGVALENPQLAKDLEWPLFGIDSSNGYTQKHTGNGAAYLSEYQLSEEEALAKEMIKKNPKLINE